MGREVTAVHMELKSSPVKLKLDRSSHNSDDDTNSNMSGLSTEVKDHHRNEGPITVGNVKNEKGACVTPIAAEDPASGDCSPNGSLSLTSEKKSQSNSPFVPKIFLDDDDNWSLSSSTAASVRTARSRTTVAVAPTFKSAERLERRKEFYAKLEEKHCLLEAEKREYEARTKEEEEVAIKQLRKSMVVRANPVPSFYYEPPPAKKELKKLPTTRAKSPNIGRRKSCGDAVRSCAEDKAVCSRALRHGVGTYNKECCSPISCPKKKGHNIGTTKQNANGSSLLKEHGDRQGCCS